MTEEGNTGKHFKDTFLHGEVYLNCLFRLRSVTDGQSFVTAPLTLKDLFFKNGVMMWKCQDVLFNRYFNAKPTLQKYLKILPPSDWIPIIKFRTADHRLPIEIYSWQITYKERHM